MKVWQLIDVLMSARAGAEVFVVEKSMEGGFTAPAIQAYIVTNNSDDDEVIIRTVMPGTTQPEEG